MRLHLEGEDRACGDVPGCISGAPGPGGRQHCQQVRDFSCRGRLSQMHNGLFRDLGTF